MEQLILTKGIRKTAEEARQSNIDAFSKLDKAGLKFGELERRLLLHSLPTGEKIYIRYPGKESARTPAFEWDFRPELQKADGTWLPDLSFKQIWDDLYELQERKIDLKLLATLFARLAFMADHEQVTKDFTYVDSDASDKAVANGKVQLTYNSYTPKADILKGIESLGSIRGVSFMAYLLYNDYLAQNEDCKYYYRSQHLRNEPWNPAIGRHNTHLTTLTVIAVMERHMHFTEAMDRFQRGRGVAPVPYKLIEQVTGGKVKKES